MMFVTAIKASVKVGVEATNSPSGLSGVAWSAWPKDHLTFTEAFIAVVIPSVQIDLTKSRGVCISSIKENWHMAKL
jgi:hypothetical protein